MGTVWRVNTTRLTYLHCKFSFLWSRSKSMWQNSCSLIEWKDCKFFSSLLTNHNLLVICWYLGGMLLLVFHCPAKFFSLGNNLDFHCLSCDPPFSLEMPWERKYRFLEVYLTKESRTLGILSSLLGADRSNALFKFDNISRFESHSQLLCWEWSQKFFSSWIGSAICAICAIRATVLKGGVGEVRSSA